MNELDMMVFRLCNQLRSQGMELEAARQEIAALRAKVAGLETPRKAEKKEA